MIKELTDFELEIYSRQIVLADIGYDGQLKLKNAKVCLIGVGGLGAPTALKLTGMGIGYLRFVDRDIVSRSDLHRQYLYDAGTVGQPKVEVAYRRLSRLNPDITLDPIPESLNSANAEEIIGGMDVVIDGLDRPEPRYVVNRTCYQYKIPYVFGAAIEAFGNVSTLLPGQTFCLECFMPGLTNEDLPTCGVVGVHPSVLGIVSAVQVSEAVRLLTGRKPKLFNKLLYIDLRELDFSILNISPSDTCRVCGINPEGPMTPIAEKQIEETCARDGRRNFVLSPRKRVAIDLAKTEEFLRMKRFQVKSAGRFGVTFEAPEDINACILKSGIMIAQTPPKPDEKFRNNVIEIYKTIIVEGLKFPASILPEA